MTLFFRNDDLGWEPQKLERLLSLFKKYSLKINCAAIPMACLNNYSSDSFDGFQDVLEIHTHGYKHYNHQLEGKKAEFGSDRKVEDVQKELFEGKKIIDDIFGKMVFPAFTPPWNRIDSNFFPILNEVGFKVLSRDGDKKSSTSGIKDLNIEFDLHTSKVSNLKGPREYADMVLYATEQVKYPVGVMLHHFHMGESDFKYLDMMLSHLINTGIKSHFYSEL